MIDRCPRTSKICFATAAKAYSTIGRAASRRRKYRPNGSAYRCRFCNLWHTTAIQNWRDGQSDGQGDAG
jgi:hypothetical protein